MVEQPSGTVTLVFTDIEGSTRLLHELGQDAYQHALAEHRRIVREACARHSGYEVNYEGDSFFYAFESAVEAIAAVEEAMAALATGPIRLRVGVHTGDPGLDPPKYVGLDVHLAARVMSVGHGGQVLVTGATRDLFDVGLRDLGEHRLKDITDPVWLYQLGDADFPPLKSLNNTNLPRPVSSFVGRQSEVAEVCALLKDGARLLTVTGPGGAGKTRFAVELASRRAREYAHGVFWVPLATLRDPALVMETIGKALGSSDGVIEHVGDRELLLVLDNLEQVIEAAPDLSELLSECPHLSMVVTSRELLRVRGEVEFALPPLAGGEAVELFCERARCSSDATIEELVGRLEGLPLAIELAAARMKLLTPEELFVRLDERLDLLKAGRDADPRQQTLRAAIQWSYDLLTEAEKQLFVRLSVFAGGCSLDAAEQVADAELDTLESLVDKSLIRRTGNRFWMLETIRDYAAERLDDETRLRHAEWSLALAEAAEPELFGPAAAIWLERLDTEHDNLRAALAFLKQSGRPELEVRLAGALWSFWTLRGFLTEGRSRFEEILAAAGDTLGVEHEKILFGAAGLSGLLGDYDRAEVLIGKRLIMSRERGDSELTASSLISMGLTVWSKGDDERALLLYTEAAELARKQGDKRLLAIATFNIGAIAFKQGDYGTTKTCAEEALTLLRELSDMRGIAMALQGLGAVAQIEGRIGEAKAYLHEALELAYELRATVIIVWCVDTLAEQAASKGNADRAARLLGASDTLRKDTAYPPDPVSQARLERIQGHFAVDLHEEGVAAARAEGQAMTLDEAVAYALAD